MAGDLAGDPLGALDVDVADPDLGALGGQPRGDRGADAAGAAGDQRLSSLQPHAARSIDWRARALPREPIPIIGGTGALGAGLAMRWAQAGVPVVLGSRSAERAEEAAAKVREAVPGADVRGSRTARPPTRARSSSSPSPSAPSRRTSTTCARRCAPGQILVDCTVPLAAAVSGKATRSLGVWQGSAAQQAQEMVPEGVTVVAALHTVGAPTLADPEAELGEDVLVCGDKKADKARVARADRADPRPARGQRRRRSRWPGSSSS